MRHFRYLGSPWGEAKLRKPKNCQECGSPIKKGEMCYRPFDNSMIRGHRICLRCGEPHWQKWQALYPAIFSSDNKALSKQEECKK